MTKAVWGGAVVAMVFTASMALAQTELQTALNQIADVAERSQAAVARAGEPANPSEPMTVGSFTVQNSKVAISGDVLQTVTSKVGERELVWLCDDGLRSIGFIFDKYMTSRKIGPYDMAVIHYRFPSETSPEKTFWQLTKSRKSAVPFTSKMTGGPHKGKSEAEVFTALALKNESVVLRVVDDADGDEITVTFPLLELPKALSVLPCYSQQ